MLGGTAFPRSFPPLIVWIAAAILVGTGGWLRLHGLSFMEFKYDEQHALVLASQVGLQPRDWPTHGMLSSNGIPNPPLFTWIVAAIWGVTQHPVSVATVIALINTVCLVPLWLWVRRQMDDVRGLLTLGIVCVSPFAVMYSRKIWTQDLLLPGVLCILWGIEWLRRGKAWLALTSLAGAVILAGQLHQSGPIALALLPPAIALQRAADRRAGTPWPGITKPTFWQAFLLGLVVILNLLLWLPYLNHLRHLPPSTFTNRPHFPIFSPFLLWRIVGQIAPSDLFYFFDEHRSDFLSDPVRSAVYQCAVVLGFPLAVYGVWRWLREPMRLPVVGLWWGFVIIAFMFAAIPTHTFYALILTPVVGAVAAGAFDSPAMPRWVAVPLQTWRIAYLIALLALTVVSQSWIEQRGGAWRDYGVGYDIREQQARFIVALRKGDQPAASSGLAEPEEGLLLWCNPAPSEVRWLVNWLEASDQELPKSLKICDRWLADRSGLRYRWRIDSQ